MNDLVAFYAAVSGLSFTLLGLWWLVADRRRHWFEHPQRRRMAYVVSLHFMLPGTMSVLSLVDPTGTFWWRLVFAVAGVAGIAGALLVSSTVRAEFGRERLGAGMLWIALLVYVLVTTVAVAPDIATLVELAPRQLEGILISLVLLLGVNAAWFLAMEPERRVTPEADGRRGAAAR